MKDTHRGSFHAQGSEYRTIDETLQIAFSGKFACGTKPRCFFTPYYVTSKLLNFHMGDYVRVTERKKGGNKVNLERSLFNVENYTNLHDFYTRTLNYSVTTTVVHNSNNNIDDNNNNIDGVTPVCYGGIFTVPGKVLMDVFGNNPKTKHIIGKLRTILSLTTTSIEEHYVERTWSSLFTSTNPLTNEQIQILRNHTTPHRRKVIRGQLHTRPYTNDDNHKCSYDIINNAWMDFQQNKRKRIRNI